MRSAASAWMRLWRSCALSLRPPPGASPQLLREDLTIRRTISDMLPDAGISSVEIERNANLVTVAVYTARPGIVIGRGGQRVDELRSALEAPPGRKSRVNLNEIRI